MVAETKAYRLLSQNKDFNQLLDNMRGKEYGLGFKQGIFTYDIPEKPTNLYFGLIACMLWFQLP